LLPFAKKKQPINKIKSEKAFFKISVKYIYSETCLNRTLKN
jgi:hypothetical protein